MNHNSPIVSATVSAAWLQEQIANQGTNPSTNQSTSQNTNQVANSELRNPAIVIVDCRFSLMEPEAGQQQYQTSHIPGAYYLDLNQDLSSPVSQHGGRHPLPDPTVLAAKFSQMGINSGNDSGNGHAPTLVVAYDDSRFAFAARLWWLLRYLGHDRVVVLDGGFRGWQSAGYATTDLIPVPKPGHFIPQPRLDWVVDMSEVKARKDLPGVVLVDSREPDRYRGEREPIDPIAGHIPGAVNYPWQEVSDAQGYLRSPREQQQRWSDLNQAQLEQLDEIIVYCGSGVTACVNLLSLELAGISGGKLYAGSWSDWCSWQEPVS